MASAGAAGALAPLVSAASTSALEMRPAGPEPCTFARSTPWAAATRAATGVTLTASGIGSGAAVVAGSAAALGSAAFAGAAPLLVVIRAMTWPTWTVSPAWARISSIVPAAGAGTSASTLSVEISTIVSSSATGSPGCLAHSRIVPSVTDSPIAGITMSSVSPAAASSAAGASSGVAAAGAAAVLGDLGEHRADAHRVALGGVDLDDGTCGRGLDLGVDLVGGDFDE